MFGNEALISSWIDSQCKGGCGSTGVVGLVAEIAVAASVLGVGTGSERVGLEVELGCEAGFVVTGTSCRVRGAVAGGIVLRASESMVCFWFEGDGAACTGWAA